MAEQPVDRLLGGYPKRAIVERVTGVMRSTCASAMAAEGFVTSI